MTAAVDVAVVGAGPAGLVTAIACAQRGLTVRVLDRRRGPIDKACGEGLMPDAVAILDRLGVELPVQRPVVGIRYLDRTVVAEGRFPGAPAAGVRRVDLHRALVDRATVDGVDVRESLAVTGLRSDDGSSRWLLDTDEGALDARWIVGADGLHSPVRRWSGLAPPPRPQKGTQRFGIRRHFRIRPWTDLVEVHWADGCEAYVTPVADDVVGVALLWSRRAPTASTVGSGAGSAAGSAAVSAAGSATGSAAGRRPAPDDRPRSFDRHLASFPVLAGRLAGAEPASRVMAAGPLRQRARGVVSRNLVLVGDAGGYLDAITGEGMALAFHQAMDVAACVGAGDLTPYPAAHARHRRVPDLLTETTLLLSRHPHLRHGALTALAHTPGLFDHILAVHVKDSPVWSRATRAAAGGTSRSRLEPRLPRSSPSRSSQRAAPTPTSTRGEGR